MTKIERFLFCVHSFTDKRIGVMFSFTFEGGLSLLRFVWNNTCRVESFVLLTRRAIEIRVEPAEIIQLALYFRFEMPQCETQTYPTSVTSVRRSTSWRWFTHSWMSLYFGKFPLFYQADSLKLGQVVEEGVSVRRLILVDSTFTFWL